ncbi:MAG: hypothetical protein DWQ19_10405 [Crenarchaeota archaeon]|nr:MAG: hypothetical protein DWQ19_10405 [Thermoproteota archaeon]
MASAQCWMFVAKHGDRFWHACWLSLVIGLFWAVLPICFYLFRRIKLLAFSFSFAILELSYRYIWKYVDELGWSTYNLGTSIDEMPILFQMADIGGAILITMLLCLAISLFYHKKYYLLASLVLVITIYGGIRMNGRFEPSEPITLVSRHEIENINDIKTSSILLTSEGLGLPEMNFDDSKLVALGHYRYEGERRYYPDINRHRHDRKYNSVLLQTAKDKKIYDKINCVPWSEFEPYNPLLSRYDRGKNCVAINHNGINYSSLICYDVAFPQTAQKCCKVGADVILVSSTESHGFKGFLAAALLANTKFRAVETRLPIVRNISGGYSGLVDSRGVYVSKLPLYLNETHITESVPIDKRISWYSIWGDWFVVCIVALGFLIGKRIKD